MSTCAGTAKTEIEKKRVNVMITVVIFIIPSRTGGDFSKLTLNASQKDTLGS